MVTADKEISARNAEFNEARARRVINEGTFSQLSVDAFQPSGLNPRKHFDESALRELADSIAAHGLLEPIVARRMPGPIYEIIAGERRWRAAKLAGLEMITAKILDKIDDRTALEMALTENLVRADIDPIEEAQGLKALMDMGFRQADIAGKINRDPSSISNSVRLLKLPEEVQEHIREGRISASHGKALVGYVETPKLLAAKLEHALQGVPSKEVEKAGYDWRLINAGAMAEVCTTDVGEEAAKECLHCNHRRKHYRADGWLCLDVDCYGAKKAARIEEITAEARRNQGLAEDVEIPRLRDLDYSSYERLSGNMPDGCTKDCKHRSIALDSDNKPIPVCLDPKCHNRLKTTKAKAEKQNAREQLRSVLNEAIMHIDAGGLDDELVILTCAGVIFSARVIPLRQTLEHLQIPLSDDDIKPSYGGPTKEQCWERLLSLGSKTVIAIAGELRIREEMFNCISLGYGSHAYTDWLMEHGVAERDQAIAMRAEAMRTAEETVSIHDAFRGQPNKTATAPPVESDCSNCAAVLDECSLPADGKCPHYVRDYSTPENWREL